MLRAATTPEMRSILGAVLVQQRDVVSEASSEWPGSGNLQVVTRRQPTDEEWRALRFAWRVCAHVKSNAVIFTAPDRTLAIGAGQMSRVDAVKTAVLKAGVSSTDGGALRGSVVASDAFFPFRDGLDAVVAAGASGGGAAGRIDARRRSGCRRRRTRHRDGLHRPPAFQALTGGFASCRTRPSRVGRRVDAPAKAWAHVHRSDVEAGL